MTSGQTTTSTPQITPLLTSSTATEPSASVSSTVPVSPPLFRFPLNAPDRMSVSGSHRQLTEGKAPLSGSILASMVMMRSSTDSVPRQGAGSDRECDPEPSPTPDPTPHNS